MVAQFYSNQHYKKHNGGFRDVLDDLGSVYSFFLDVKYTLNSWIIIPNH